MAVKKVNVAASDLYPLVHALLASSGMKAAAAALQKEAKLVHACVCAERWMELLASSCCLS